MASLLHRALVLTSSAGNELQHPLKVELEDAEGPEPVLHDPLRCDFLQEEKRQEHADGDDDGAKAINIDFVCKACIQLLETKSDSPFPPAPSLLLQLTVRGASDEVSLSTERAQDACASLGAVVADLTRVRGTAIDRNLDGSVHHGSSAPLVVEGPEARTSDVRASPRTLRLLRLTLDAAVEHVVGGGDGLDLIAVAGGDRAVVGARTYDTLVQLGGGLVADEDVPRWTLFQSQCAFLPLPLGASNQGIQVDAVASGTDRTGFAGGGDVGVVLGVGQTHLTSVGLAVLRVSFFALVLAGPICVASCCHKLAVCRQIVCRARRTRRVIRGSSWAVWLPVSDLAVESRSALIAGALSRESAVTSSLAKPAAGPGAKRARRTSATRQKAAARRRDGCGGAGRAGRLTVEAVESSSWTPLLELPSLLCEFGGQLLQIVAPPSANLPAEQTVQAMLSTSDLYRPAGHCTQPCTVCRGVRSRPTRVAGARRLFSTSNPGSAGRTVCAGPTAGVGAVHEDEGALADLFVADRTLGIGKEGTVSGQGERTATVGARSAFGIEERIEVVVARADREASPGAGVGPITELTDSTRRAGDGADGSKLSSSA
eukprot:766645-Hanusia_phi.AAC.4